MTDKLSICEACGCSAPDLIEDKLLTIPLCPKCAKLFSSRLRREADIYVPPVPRASRESRKQSALMRFQKYHKTADLMQSKCGVGSRNIEKYSKVKKFAPDLASAACEETISIGSAYQACNRRCESDLVEAMGAENEQ